MSQAALPNYRAAREQRLGANDARRIRAERDKARSSTSGAARRWPFELLQNAHDPGPRDGSSLVDFRLEAAGSTLLFQHNGRPFTLDDLAALLSGGSNKDYDSRETAGRFGTGFLVTHVLSPRITLRGLVSAGSQCERFEINLDRSGNEQAILDNTKAAEDSIERAEPIQEPDTVWTAESEYPIDAHDAMDVGIETIRSSTPFLFGTCQHLGRVTIQRRDGFVESWHPEPPTQYQHDGVTVRDRQITLKSNGSSTVYRVLRLMPADAEDIALVLVARRNTEHGEFQRVPEAGTHTFSVGPYRMEVKATTTGEVRLTPAQAKVASTDDSFVLCIVDLRGSDPARLAEPWTTADIEPGTRGVIGLRQAVSETHELVEAATEQEIAIRNEGKLRYGVPSTIWQSGKPIQSWVDEIAPGLH